MSDFLPTDRAPDVSSTLVCHGDSLTAATAGNTPYSTILQWLMADRLVVNQSVPGQTAQRCAARLGSAPVYITLTGNAFNAAAPVNCTLYDANSQLLSTASDTNTRTMSGLINGIPCFLTRTQPSGVETYTVTPAYSTTQAIPANSLFIPDDGFNIKNALNILWWGRNNVPSILSGVSALYDDAVALMASPKKFIILGILPGYTETIGSANYIAVAAVNDALAQKWGANFIPMSPPTVAEFARIKKTMIGQDTTDINNGVFPNSLRQDSVHLNTAGYNIIANRVYDKIQSFGW